MALKSELACPSAGAYQLMGTGGGGRRAVMELRRGGGGRQTVGGGRRLARGGVSVNRASQRTGFSRSLRYNCFNTEPQNRIRR